MQMLKVSICLLLAQHPWCEAITSQALWHLACMPCSLLWLHCSGKKAAVAKAAAAEELGEVDDSEWTVLCAKVLTNSDANSGRIILPRIYVEANLSFVIGYRSVSE